MGRARAEESSLTLILRRSTHTYALWGIWLLEALNYAVHVVLRPVPWNTTSVLIGYALWAVQLWCFAACQLVDPGKLPPDWERLAQSGAEDSTVCKRSGLLLPPRGRYVRRAGGVVLGLDHFCHWLGTPVGFRNRKLFILFISYSTLFCIMGSVHSAYAGACMLVQACVRRTHQRAGDTALCGGSVADSVDDPAHRKEAGADEGAKGRDVASEHEHQHEGGRLLVVVLHGACA